MLTADWRNPVNALDINNDRQITAFDAIPVINELNLNGVHDLPLPKPDAAPFYDFNNSGTISAFDVIPVINLLNSTPAFPIYQLIEQPDKLLQEYAITITSGSVTAGNRLYQLKVQPNFDLSDHLSANEDAFLAYLVDPATGETLIDWGARGGALFSLAGSKAELHSGLVQWDGTFLTIDLSQFNSRDTLELRMQLLNLDGDGGTRLSVTPWSNQLDSAGIPLVPGPNRPLPQAPGTTIDPSSLIVIPDLRVELANISYQSATGRFTAEARVVNDSTTMTLNPVSISFPRVTSVTAANSSGSTNGETYWSFAGVAGSGPLAPQAASPWLKVEWNAPANQPLDLFAVARGALSTEDQAAFGVFSGFLTDVSEQYFAHFNMQANDDFLVVPIHIPSPVPTTRLVNNLDVVIANTPTTLTGPFYPVDSPLTGEFQLQLTATGAGFFSFAVHNLETVELLQPDDRHWGVFDYRQGPQVYAIEGATGDRLIIDNLLRPGERIGVWQLLSEDSTSIGFANLLGGDLEVTLPKGGRYYLTHSPPDNSTAITRYDFAIRTPQVFAHALTFNAPVSVTMSSFAERHEYSFTGALNQQIIVDSLVQNGEEISLVDPLGEELSFSQEQPIVLDQAGSWKLVVKSAAPGNVTFRVLDVASLPMATDGTLLNGLVTSAQPDFFRVPMVAGQRLTLAPGNPNLFVIDLMGTSGQTLSPTTPLNYGISETGTGVLRIRRNVITPENRLYTYTANRSLADSVAAGGFNFEYLGSLGTGQSLSVPFTASAGTPIFVDWLIDPAAATTVNVQLREPSGQLTFLTRSLNTKDSNIVTLTQSGNHEIVLSNPGSVGTGGYAVRVIDLSAAPLITLGDSIGGTLTSFRTLARRVDPEIGDRLLIESLLSSYNAPHATVRIYRDKAFEFPYTTDEDHWVTEFTSTQQHYILIEQLTSTSTPVTVQTQLMQNAAALPLGTSVSVTMPPQTGKLFRFPTQAGQKFFVDYVSANPFGVVYMGLAGDGLTNFVVPGYPIVREIDTTGEQYFYLKNPTDADATYSFVATLLTAASPSTPLVFDVPQTVTLASVGERKIFTFSAEEGQLLYFDGLDRVGDEANFRIIDEATGELSDFSSTSGNFMHEVPRTGSYALILGDDVGTFHFRVVDVRNTPLVALDTNFTGSITGDRQAAIWRFEPTAYQKLFVDSNATAAMRFESPLRVHRRNGQSSGFTSAAIDNDFSATAGDEGVHYLVAEGGTIPFNYDLRIRTPDVNTLPVPIGSLTTGQINDQTEFDEYTFAGTRGQRIHLDLVNSSVTLTLLKPDGTTLASAGDHSYLLPETVTYRVRVTGTVPVPYQFYLLAVNAQPTLPLDAPVAGSTTAADVHLFRLPGSAGQRFNFDSQLLSGATTNVRWLLYSPQGTEVFDVAFASGDQTITLAETGDYLLALRAPSGAINFGFQVNSVAQTPVASSGLDQTYSGNIPGSQSANVTFTASAGQRVFLDVLDRSSFQPSVRLFGPGDVVVTSSITQDGWLSLPFSGNYRLQLTSGSSASAYSLRLTDAGNLTPITIGMPFSITLDQAHESLIWPVDATVGDRRMMELAQAPFSGSFTLQRPDGSSINASDTQNSPTITTFTQTGRHYLVLKGSTLSTPLTWSALVWDPAMTTAIELNTPISGQLSPIREYHLFNIELAAGERIYVEPTAWSLPNTGDWNLFDPSGAIVSNGTSNNLSTPFAYTATKTGRYTLVLYGSGSGVFDYTFRVKKVAITHQLGMAFDHGFET